MVEKLATPAGRTAYAERKWLSEAPNGWIKHVLGFRRFSLRGLAKGAHSRFPGHALTPTGVMAIRCKQFHLPDL